MDVSALVLQALAGGVAAYAAMRVELRALRRDVERAADAADAAHRRIDEILTAAAKK